MSKPIDPLAAYAALMATVPASKPKAQTTEKDRLPFSPIFLLSLICSTPNGGALAVGFQPAYTSRKSGDKVDASEVLLYWPSLKYAQSTTEAVDGKIVVKEKAIITKWNHAYFRDGAAAYNKLEMLK